MAIVQKQAFCPDCQRLTLHVKSTVPFQGYHCQVCGRKEPFPCLAALIAALLLGGGCLGGCLVMGRGCESPSPSPGPSGLPDTKAAADQAARDAAAKKSADDKAARDRLEREAAAKAKAKRDADEAAADALFKPASADLVRGAAAEAERQLRKIATDYPDTKAGQRSKELLKQMGK